MRKTISMLIAACPAIPISPASAHCRDSANARPLSGAMLPWFGYHYQASKADAQDPRLNLIAADLRGLPPTTIINAQIDPLRSDGEPLAAAMRTS